MPANVEDNGDVVFLARAPGQVADNSQGSGTVAIRGARSGNKNFDPRTGRFAGGGSTVTTKAAPQNPVAVNRSGIPQGVTVDEWNRRLDTIRQAARSMPSLDPGAATDFLSGKVADISKVDVQQFLIDVKAQQVDDLIDAFDTQLRKKTTGAKVSMSSSAVRVVFSSLNQQELSSLVARLLGRGFTAKQIGNQVGKRIKDVQTKQSIAEQLGIKLDDEDDGIRLDFSDWDPEPEPDPVLVLAEAVKDLAQRPQEPPVVQVAPAEVRVELPRPMGKRIVRDDTTGDIIGVEPVDG